MRSISGKELHRILLRHGWRELRIQGSHLILGKVGSIVRLSVPIHGNTALKAGLLNHLLQMAGLTDKDLQD